MYEAEARQLLDLEPTASPSQLKAAYRRMLKRWHPDLFSTDPASYPEAIRQTQRINDAYHLLVWAASRQDQQPDRTEAVAWSGRPIRTVENWPRTFWLWLTVLGAIPAAIDILHRLL